MKEVDPPPPLDAGADTPEELRAVLRALGREAPGRGTLERVARGLGPYLDAAPGLTVPAAATVARTGGKLLVARTVAALLALGGTAYLVQRALQPEPMIAARQLELPAQGERVQATPEPRAVGPAVVEPAVVAPSVVEPVVLPAAAPHAAAPARVRAARAHRHHLRHRREIAVESAPAVESTPAEATVVAPAVEPEAPVAVARAPEPAAEEQPAKVAEAPPPDEFSLLWQARERLRRDPAGALALLDAHAGRFTNGQLAPEREVLAVEALRQLGRTDEADARVRSFRARYPGSIHLRRLQKGQ